MGIFESGEMEAAIQHTSYSLTEVATGIMVWYHEWAPRQLKRARACAQTGQNIFLGFWGEGEYKLSRREFQKLLLAVGEKFGKLYLAENCTASGRTIVAISNLSHRERAMRQSSKYPQTDGIISKGHGL
jgi:phage/plasmid-associated DNA primase